MTNRLEPPLLDDHEHHLDPAHNGDHDHHHHDHGLPVIEEPLDPASQSLSDALKASFRVLKVIMLVVVVLFLFSGVFSVNTDERAVVWTFGKLTDVKGPGLQIAAPYPISEVVRVKTSPRTLEIKAFWLAESEADKNRPLSEREPRGQRLDPATDGALLTGDRGIVHMRFTAWYQVTKPEDFVQNVSDETALLNSVLQNAAIAEAARSRTDDLLKLSKGQGSEMVSRIRTRAQQALDAIHSGIMLVDVTADKSHYPLQTKDAFVKVSTAANQKQEAIQEALSEQTKKLNGVAGNTWRELYEQIQRLDQVKDESEQEAILKEIDRLLVEEAQGEVSGRIRMAESRKQQLIAEAQTRKERFEAILNEPEYKINPDLIKQRFRQKAVSELFAQSGVTKWLLPAGQKEIMLWLGKDPAQTREAERERIRRQAEQQ